MPHYSPRTYNDILTDLVNYFVGANGQVTDFTPGSVIRTLMEGVAQEADRLYAGMLVGINEAQENSSYTTFGFQRLQPVQAYGQVLFTMRTDSTVATDQVDVIPTGSTVSISGSATYKYTLQGNVTLTYNAPSQLGFVVALYPGSIYNAAAGSINTYDPGDPLLASVTNPRAFITGSDLETDAQRRERFSQFLVGIQRATKNAILYGINQTVVLDPGNNVVERVVKSNTIETAPGTIYVYIDNGSGNSSQDLVNAAQNQLSGYTDSQGVVHPGWKAAGITSFVQSAQPRTIPITLSVEPQLGFAPPVVQTTVGAAIKNYFSGLNVGDMFRLQNMLQGVSRAQGVLDIQSVVTPNTNIPMSPNQIAMPGTITVTIITS